MFLFFNYKIDIKDKSKPTEKIKYPSFLSILTFYHKKKHFKILFKKLKNLNFYFQDSQPSTIAVLTLRKPRVAKKVEWSNDTVDNENMNKKKSKCKYTLH